MAAVGAVNGGVLGLSCLRGWGAVWRLLRGMWALRGAGSYTRQGWRRWRSPGVLRGLCGVAATGALRADGGGVVPLLAVDRVGGWASSHGLVSWPSMGRCDGLRGCALAAGAVQLRGDCDGLVRCLLRSSVALLAGAGAGCGSMGVAALGASVGLRGRLRAIKNRGFMLRFLI